MSRRAPGGRTLERAGSEAGVPGTNSWSVEGYIGPCPPPGEEHLCVFNVYAVTAALGLPAGIGAVEVLGADGWSGDRRGSPHRDLRPLGAQSVPGRCQVALPGPREVDRLEAHLHVDVEHRLVGPGVERVDPID